MFKRAKKAIHAAVNGALGNTKATKAVVKTAEIVTSLAMKGVAKTTKAVAKDAGKAVV